MTTVFSAAEHYATYTQPAPEYSGPIYPGEEPGQKPEPTTTEIEVNVMSFNIRQSGANNELDGDNGWLKRQKKVMDYYLHH